MDQNHCQHWYVMKIQYRLWKVKKRFGIFQTLVGGLVSKSSFSQKIGSQNAKRGIGVVNRVFSPEKNSTQFLKSLI